MDTAVHRLTYMDTAVHRLTYTDTTVHRLTYMDTGVHRLTYMDTTVHRLIYMDSLYNHQQAQKLIAYLRWKKHLHSYPQFILYGEIVQKFVVEVSHIGVSCTGKTQLQLSKYNYCVYVNLFWFKLLSSLQFHLSL